MSSTDAQAIIAALNQQIGGFNRNIQTLNTRVDGQFAVVDRRLNGVDNRFRALDEGGGGGGCGAASSAGSVSTATGAGYATGAAGPWGEYRPNTGPTINPYAVPRPRDDSIEAEYLKPIKKRRLIHIGGPSDNTASEELIPWLDKLRTKHSGVHAAYPSGRLTSRCLLIMTSNDAAWK